MKKLLAVLCSVFTSALFAALVVDPSMSDNCVLLQNAENIVTGKTTAGRTVTVKLGGTQLGSATAGSDGAFTVAFNPGAASFTARTVEVSDGSETKSFGNVLVGEVWLVSGQSNAQYWLGWKDFAGINQEWFADVDYPNCRMYTILKTDSDSGNPSGTLDPNRCWKVFNLENSKYFSAIGFFFAKELYKGQNVPVGIIVAAQGGSGINEWLTEETVKATGFTSGLAGTSRCATRVEPDSRVRTRGVLWYQGETDGFSGQGQTYYQNALPLLINQWREKQENPNYPVLLMSFPQSVSYDASEGRYPAIREAQEVVTKTVANVVKVPAIDLGSSHTEGFGKCLHPDDKDEAGRRCYLAARNLVYGETSFRYRCPQPAKAMWNSDKTEARVIMPSDTVLNWTNETPVAYSYLPFIFKDASGNRQQYLPGGARPSVSLSADGRVILCKANSTSTTVGYCQKLENSTPMETQIVDQDGYPLPAFREFPIANYEAHTHAYGPVGYHWVGVTACTAGKSCTVCGECLEEEGVVQVTEDPTTHAKTGTATFRDYPSATRTTGAVKAHATLIVKGLPGNYGVPTPGYGTHTDMPLGVSYTATAPAGTFALPDGTTTSCTGHVFTVGNGTPVKSDDATCAFTPEEDVTYTLTWLYSGAMHVHHYEPFEYVWTGYEECSAFWSCACGETINEGAYTITSAVTKVATCAPGERTYFAHFATLGSATKVETISPVSEHDWGSPTYTWGANHASCAAKAVCSRDESHVTNENVTAVRMIVTPATTEAKGLARYTATFASEIFAQQIVEVEIPKVGTADYYVSASGSDSNAGTSRDQAFKTIAKAVAEASSGKKICVLPGLYPVTAAVTVDKDVMIYGETEDPADVVVRNVAEGWPEDVNEWTLKTGPERVFVLNSSGAVLSGVAVEGGKIGGTEAVGGDILINENGGTVTNCIIRNAKVHALYNGTAKSKAGGAGIACLSANGLVTHCVITNNFLTRGNVAGNDSVFTEGGSVGAHLTAGTIRQSLIAFNTTTNDKLASALWMKGGALAENCTVAGNRGLGTEGHFYPVLVVPNNVATVRNCLIYGNTGVNGETALIDLTGVPSPYVPKVAPCFVNCATDMTPLADMTIVTTGITVVNAASGDFRPAEGSSIIDAGATMSSPVSLDLIGNPRVSGEAVDIGCYEFTGAEPPPPPPHTHVYTTTNYNWSADYSSCIAKATCGECPDFFEEAGNLTTNRVAGDCETPGTVTYTATFATLGSTSKTIEEPADHVWGTSSYSWNTQGWTCTATAICTRNAAHETNETVSAVYAVVTPAKVGVAGLGRYTATFAGSMFSAQTYDVEIPAKEPTEKPEADYYVSPDPSVGSDDNDGSLEAPFATIVHAVSIAQGGETICLLTGTHLVTSSTAANVSGTGVTVAKAITIVGETGDPADVIVRNVATGWSDDFTKFSYCYARVFEINHQDAVLSGVTVEEGKIGGTDQQGGNILINSNGGTVTNCIIRNAKMHAYWGGAKNKAGGAGIACLSANGLITHCIITNNLATRKSLACAFGNATQAGGAAAVHITAGVLRESLVAYNATTNDNVGSAVYIGGAGTLMENCTLAANRGLGSEGTFYPVLFYPNASESNNPLVRNTLIVGGESTDLFDAVWTTQYAGTLATAGKRFVNCATDRTVPASGFDSMITTGISLTGDFRPTAGSSVIDAGAEMNSPVALDLAGNARIVNDVVDIGCYEFAGAEPPAPQWDIPGAQGGINGMDNGKGGKCIRVTSISIVNGALTVGFEAGEVDADGETFALVCKENLTDEDTFTIVVTLTNGAESTLGTLAGLTDKPQLFILGIGPRDK